MPTIAPSGPVAVVPATWTIDPTRTAREYPTTGSHGAPLETLRRGMQELTCSVHAPLMPSRLHYLGDTESTEEDMMRVVDMMQRDVKTVAEDATVAEAVTALV